MSPILWSARRLARTPIPDRFFIDPILPVEGIALIHGKRALGKTHLALTVATCATEGGILFGRYPTRQSSVVIVQADMPISLQQARVQAIRREYALDRLYFHFPRRFNLLTLSEDDRFVKRIRSVAPSLIVWDTLRKIHRGSSNDDDTPSAVYSHARALFPGVTHIFVHHDKKTQIDAQGALDPDEAFRGSGAWLDDADLGMHVIGHGRGWLTLHFTRVRAAEEQPPVNLFLDEHRLLLYARGDPRPLIEEWRRRAPHGSPNDLLRFLLASFACSPAIARAAAFGDRRG